MKAYFKLISVVGAIALLLFTGCIRDDYSDCKQGLIVSFYSKTSCSTDTIRSVVASDAILCVFDESEVLITLVKRNQVAFDTYMEEIELPRGGNYSVVAWTGMDASLLLISEMKTGITRKSDLLFRLKRMQDVAVGIDGLQIYSGGSASVYVEEKDSESTYEKVAVNLLEVTNRLHLLVKGVEQENEYEVYVESDNGSMDVDGTLAEDVVLRHDPVVSFDSEWLKTEFTLLKLDSKQVNTLVVRNKTTGKELYRGDLLNALLLKTPDVNLGCDHDYTFEVIVSEHGTYANVEIWINGWLVHSYDAEM